MLADGDWANWRHFGEKTTKLADGSSVVTDSNWRGTWRAGVGRRYRISPKLSLQTGASYDSSPVSEWNQTPELPVDRQVRVSAGAQFQMFRPLSSLASQIAPIATSFPAGQPRLLHPGISCFVASARSGYAIRPSVILGASCGSHTHLDLGRAEIINTQNPSTGQYMAVTFAISPRE